MQSTDKDKGKSKDKGGERGEDLFEYATRHALRFPSPMGELDAERLWQVPLRSRDGRDLDAVAKAAEKAFQASEKSFVEKRKTPAQTKLEKAFEIVRHVIAVKLEEEAAAEKRAANKAERDKIMEALESKQDGRLQRMSEAALQARLAELDE